VYDQVEPSAFFLFSKAEFEAELRNRTRFSEINSMGRARSPSFASSGAQRDATLAALSGLGATSPLSVVVSPGLLAPSDDASTVPLPLSPMPQRQHRLSTERLSTERVKEEEEELEELPSPRNSRQLSISTINALPVSMDSAFIVVAPSEDDIDREIAKNAAKRMSWTDEVVESELLSEEIFTEPIADNTSMFWSNWLDSDEKEVRLA
jgi:hypothetical protein